MGCLFKPLVRSHTLLSLVEVLQRVLAVDLLLQALVLQVLLDVSSDFVLRVLRVLADLYPDIC